MTYEAAFMERWRAVLVREDATRVTVAVGSQPDPRLRRLLESYHGKRVSFALTPEPELSVVMQRAAAFASAAADPAVEPDGALAIGGVSGRAPAVDLINAMLNDAIAQRASDVHLESGDDGISARYRVDGILRDAPRFTRGTLGLEHFRAISGRLKSLARLNVTERRRPQDGRFSVRLAHDAFDVRLSTMPTIAGESIVLRLFPRTRRAYRLEQLGMPDAILSHVDRLVRSSSGMLLISGPTGSGKTTTLHAALMRINDRRRKIITIEDPVEYRLPNVEQIQTNDAAGLTFDVLLRTVLRQDPDVIMVGEIRDSATALLSVRAALTGHLVLATVHSRSASDVRARIVDLGVDARIYDAIDATSIAQRLVRTRCACASGGIDPNCARCYGTGLAGRTAIFGILAPILRFRIEDDARAKSEQGITTAQEVACVLNR